MGACEMEAECKWSSSSLWPPHADKLGTDWGYYATYSVNTTALVLAMLYTTFLCKEHPDGNYIVRKEKKSEDQVEEEERAKSLVKRGCENFVQPVRELKETVSRKRGPHKRTAIIIILLCVSIYNATVNEFYFTFYFLQVSAKL